ncbi:MAG: L,D-transpeptidase [Plectolyngbya sp. WJT66-NPBG17]|jgi:lipoprotein-anchoring transpeptidase ErfK/SrfK|nr:L,D-transpeptidase [Plectolyngbya sp. WJT66-NPBG17]MBW4523873.1 L,D-transpeptidase [Phormidium tanganyikae FI6-MK23]
MKRVLGLVGVIVLIGGMPVMAAPDWRSTAEITLSEPEMSPLQVVVRTGTRRVYLYEGKVIIASYAIAVGKAGWETPPGEYQVFSKEVNPVFKNFKTGRVIKPGLNNPLGVRWIGFWTDGKTQLGFHGTNEPELIGQAVSHGCIRMRNKDVTALFEKVSIGTPVIVEP